MTEQEVAKIVEEKTALLESLNQLSEKLDRCPERWEWFLHSDKQWWKYFPNWSDFIIESGIFEKLPDNQRRVRRSPVGGISELCEVLWTLQERLGRSATLSDWDEFVSDTASGQGQKLRSGLEKCAKEIPRRVDGPLERSLEELWEDFLDYANSHKSRNTKPRSSSGRKKRNTKRKSSSGNTESIEDLLKSMQEIAAKQGLKIELKIIL